MLQPSQSARTISARFAVLNRFMLTIMLINVGVVKHYGQIDEILTFE